MEYVAKIIEKLVPEDARSVLYYVSRYVKQARYFDIYNKDVFKDTDGNSPSLLVRAQVDLVIAAIEKAEGCKAAEIGPARVSLLLFDLTQLEKSLGNSFSDEELSAATAFLENLEVPRSDM